MKIGVVSDTHGRIAAIAAALAALEERGAELVIHCGDIDGPEAVRAFAGWDVHFVYGNCDWDRSAIARAAGDIGAQLHDPFGNLELAGKQIAWIHGDNARLLRDLENSEHYDYLFFGHSHVAERHVSGRTQVINPGALHRARPKTCLLVDLATGALDPIALPG